MNTLTRPLFSTFELPRLVFLRLWRTARRRQATIDLIHASPHLLRDVGATEDRLHQCRR